MFVAQRAKTILKAKKVDIEGSIAVCYLFIYLFIYCCLTQTMSTLGILGLRLYICEFLCRKNANLLKTSVDMEQKKRLDAELTVSWFSLQVFKLE